MRFKFAFSLVEMLMALLVASLLMVALAPVLTKKNTTQNINITGGSAFIPKVFCAYVNDTNEIIIKDTEQTGCVVPEKTYTANVLMAAGGGGGGGAVGKGTGTFRAPLIDSNVPKTNGHEIVFDRLASNIVVEMTAGGGAGGGGAYFLRGLGSPTKQSDCEPFGVYISKENNGNTNAVCVSKYNPDDLFFSPTSTNEASPSIPTSGPITISTGSENYTLKNGVTVLPSDGSTTSSACDNGECCWKPNSISQPTAVYCDVTTSGRITSGFNGAYYSGCFRTVCQWRAAQAICTNWKPLGEGGPTGRLPTENEAKSWPLNNISSKPSPLNWTLDSAFAEGGYGLQLCEQRGNATSTGSPRCYYRLACKGAAKGYVGTTTWQDWCNAEGVWTKTQSVSTYKTLIFSGTSSSMTGGLWATNANSVRCVVDETRVFRSYTGGGGSGGSYVKISIPDEVLKKAFELGMGKGKIKVYPGKGGEGGTPASNSGKDANEGKDGSPSKVEIYSSSLNGGSEELIYLLEIPGGYGGGGSKGGDETVSNTGTNGAPKYSTEEGALNPYPVPKCKYYNKTGSKYNTNQSGHIVDCSEISGFAAGAPASLTAGGNNPNLDSAGSGGNGSACVEDGDGALCSAGLNGSNGRIRITNTPVYSGAGGGGGGAGSFAIINNLQVRPNDLIKVQIGNGGIGGSVGSKGSDGGASIIEITRNGGTVSKYTVLGGEGGGAAVIGEPDKNLQAKAGVGGKGGISIGEGGAKITESFPKNPEDGSGSAGGLSENYITATGGNGGFNPKISALASTDGTLNGKSCGGFSTNSIKINDTTEWECSNSSYIPLPLTRALEDGVFSNNIIVNLAPGSTGGGGGGYDYNASTSASGGAKGMGGYVYIYFNDWSEEESE